MSAYYLGFPAFVNGQRYRPNNTQYHLTLKYLGDLTPTGLYEVKRLLEGLDGLSLERDLPRFQFLPIHFGQKLILGAVRHVEVSEALHDARSIFSQVRADTHPFYIPHVTVDGPIWSQAHSNGVGALPGQVGLFFEPLAIMGGSVAPKFSGDY